MEQAEASQYPGATTLEHPPVVVASMKESQNTSASVHLTPHERGFSKQSVLTDLHRENQIGQIRDAMWD